MAFEQRLKQEIEENPALEMGKDQEMKMKALIMRTIQLMMLKSLILKI